MVKRLGSLELFTLEEIGEELGVTPTTLRTYISKGLLAGRKIGNSWFVTQDSLKQFIEGGVELPADEGGSMEERRDAVEILTGFYDDVVEEMGEQFTSHEFILELAHEHQREYIDGLASFKNSQGEPFQALHSILAKKLKEVDSIELLDERHQGKNIFNVQSGCALWRKIG